MERFLHRNTLATTLEKDYSQRNKPMTTLDEAVEDKTGILTILKETKNEIKEQIKELYDEEDPELFLQYAKTVSNYNPKLYVFDLYPTKVPHDLIEKAR